MTIKVEEETEAGEETNLESETVATTNVKVKKADAEDKDAPNSHANIATLMVAAHIAVLNAIPKEPGTKIPPPLKTCREASP